MQGRVINAKNPYVNIILIIFEEPKEIREEEKDTWLLPIFKMGKALLKPP